MVKKMEVKEAEKKAVKVETGQETADIKRNKVINDGIGT